MGFTTKQATQISQWVDAKDFGEKAAIKIKGIRNQAYAVARERSTNQIQTKGFDPSRASSEDLTSLELLFMCTAHHLIEDWQGIEIDGVDTPFSPDTALKVMREGGEEGLVFWHFVDTEAKRIQEEADKVKDDAMGKSESSTSGQSTKNPK